MQNSHSFALRRAADQPVVDKSTNETVVQYAVQLQFKGKSPAVAAKLTAQKLGGGTNMFLGSGIVFIDPKKLEAAIWANMVDYTLNAMKRSRPSMDSFHVNGTARYFKLQAKDTQNLFALVTRALGRPLDDSQNPFMKGAAQRVAALWLQANQPSVLDGLDRRQAMGVANKVIQSAKLMGFFNDSNWAPVQRIWSALTKAGIDWDLEKNWYDKDERGNPSAKTWTFRITWKDKAGRPQVGHGRVVASGGGSVDDPLDRYDVTAYVG